jgi:hypothetical protein
VAVRVVDALEVVQVGDDQAHAPGAEPCLERLVEGPAVAERGERVEARELARLLTRLPELDALGADPPHEEQQEHAETEPEHHLGHDLAGTGGSGGVEGGRGSRGDGAQREHREAARRMHQAVADQLEEVELVKWGHAPAGLPLEQRQLRETDPARPVEEVVADALGAAEPVRHSAHADQQPRQGHEPPGRAVDGDRRVEGHEHQRHRGADAPVDLREAPRELDVCAGVAVFLVFHPGCAFRASCLGRDRQLVKKG